VQLHIEGLHPPQDSAADSPGADRTNGAPRAGGRVDAAHCLQSTTNRYRGTAMVRARLRYEYVVAVVFVTGLFMEILDTTIVNVALPTLGREFGVGTSSIEWVVIGYLLSLAVWIPASGWIGDGASVNQESLLRSNQQIEKIRFRIGAGTFAKNKSLRFVGVDLQRSLN
jgi:hypothetical protein